MNEIKSWFPAITFVIVLAATFGWVLVGDESFTGPTGSMGDDVYFENIAFQLAKGEGIKFDFTEIEWQQPYRDANESGQNDWILHLKAKGLTTSRSPGFPLVVSLIYRVFGRQFMIVRIVNIVLLAAAITLLLTLVYRSYGLLAGTLALVTISLDCFVLRTAGQFMTEALGTAIVCVLFSSCVWLTRPRLDEALEGDTSIETKDAKWSRTDWGWLGVGLLFGFGALVRANLNAWLPLIGIALAIGVIWQWWFRLQWRPLLKYGTLFCVGVGLIAAPYWYRNCMVTGGFTPLGTSGSFGLIGGYCDRAYEDYGNWSIRDSVESQQITMARPGFYDLKLAEQEKWMGEDSQRIAKQWLWANWRKFPALVGMKAISHLGFYRQPWYLQILNGLLFFGAVIGCYAAWRTFGFWVLAFLLLSTITTCLAWPHYGRYSIPLRPLIHGANAIGTVAFWTYILRKPKSQD